MQHVFLKWYNIFTLKTRSRMFRSGMKVSKHFSITQNWKTGKNLSNSNIWNWKYWYLSHSCERAVISYYSNHIIEGVISKICSYPNRNNYLCNEWWFVVVVVIIRRSIWAWHAFRKYKNGQKIQAKIFYSTFVLKWVMRANHAR